MAGRYAAVVPTPEPRVIAPISAWIAAFGLAAGVIGAAWYAVTAAGIQPEAPFTDFNRARIESFAARASAAGARRVLLLGSSALKYATRGERDFGADVARAAGVPVETLRVTSNWGTFYDFAPLADDLLRAQPDLVVMESELLAADRPPWRRFSSGSATCAAVSASRSRAKSLSPRPTSSSPIPAGSARPRCATRCCARSAPAG